MSIVRVVKDKNYSVIDNTVLNDHRLSWKAKGLAAYLLSKPDNWQIVREQLEKESTDGIASVRAGLKELEGFGYLIRTRTHGEDGRFSWEHVLHERPLAEKQPVDTPSAEKPPMVNPPMEKPPVDNRTLISTVVVSTDRPSTETAGGLELDGTRAQPLPRTQPPAPAPQPPTNTFGTPLDDPRISLDALPDVQPRSRSKPREVNEGQAPPGQLVKRGTGADAYWIFREYFPQTLTNRQMEMVRETVTDLTRWRAVCERWAELYGNDWRKFGHLDWYRGEIPGEGGTHHGSGQSAGVHRANHQTGQRPHYADYQPAEYDDARAAELNGWA